MTSPDPRPGENAPPDTALDWLDPVHRRIVTVALRAAARHGFALGGNNALLAYGIISRAAPNINLLTDRKDVVRAVAGPVAEALRADGFILQPSGQLGGLAGWTVTGRPGPGTVRHLATRPQGPQPPPREDGQQASQPGPGARTRHAGPGPMTAPPPRSRKTDPAGRLAGRQTADKEMTL